MLEIIEDTLIDAIKLLPFLFITYLIMEYIEHKMGHKTKQAIKKSGKWGPIIGSILGVFPQCGFSVSATNLYAGRVITLGTLIAVYLSTSDEMLPIFISEAVSPIIILKILGIKLVIGMIAGIIIDLIVHIINNKIINIVAGIIFLWRAFNGVWSIISQAVGGYLFYINPIYLVMNFYGIIVLSIMGVFAFRQKKRGKVLNVLGIVYIGYIIINIITSMQYGFSASALTNLAILITAFVLSQKSSGGTVFDTKDTSSEAAKVQAQAEKQTSIYDEQLRDGILTQEEYDQIMKSNK